MASTEVQQQVSFGPTEHSALDGILRHHLSLEPQSRGLVDANSDQLSSSLDTAKLESADNAGKSTIHTQTSTARNKVSRQFSRPTVHQNTLESDNKKRPIVLRRNSTRYKPPSPEPPDPNSEAKSLTIKRMQVNLTEWDKKLEEINTQKLKKESIHQSELSKRDEQIRDLTEKLSNECDSRAKAEHERDDLAERLANTEEELTATKEHCDQLQSDLSQYEAAYEEVNTQRMELEDELSTNNEQLQQSESMRRRLNDHVTELQGQLAIEEQRSRFCAVM